MLILLKGESDVIRNECGIKKIDIEIMKSMYVLIKYGNEGYLKNIRNLKSE